MWYCRAMIMVYLVSILESLAPLNYNETNFTYRKNKQVKHEYQM